MKDRITISFEIILNTINTLFSSSKCNNGKFSLINLLNFSILQVLKCPRIICNVSQIVRLQKKWNEHEIKSFVDRAS